MLLLLKCAVDCAEVLKLIEIFVGTLSGMVGCSRLNLVQHGLMLRLLV